MRHGQTNGIPQGSVLMDFIAEMVLGFADLELSKKIKAKQIGDYQILRYRDDYRIFVNNPQDGERILKCLTEVMIDLGLKLNTTKTKASSAVICASIKPDKLEWLFRKKPYKNLQNYLLMIHDHAIEFPDSGSLVCALADFHKKIRRAKLDKPMPLIAIVVDIAYHNPRTYPLCAGILSWLLKCLGDDEKQTTVEKIKKRFDLVPNTGYLQIWLQRITYRFEQTFLYEEKICHLVAGEQKNLWNSEWVICEKLRNIIDDPCIIIDKKRLEKLPPEIANEEIALFTYG
jgi:RNA-directed DNA polymerase